MIPFGMKSAIVQYVYQKNYDKLVEELLTNLNDKAYMIGFLLKKSKLNKPIKKTMSWKDKLWKELF